MNYFDDVGAFHDRFDLPHAHDDEGLPPAPLAPDVLSYRIAFMIEELAEFCASQGASDTASRLREVEALIKEMAPEVAEEGVVPARGLADGADALADLVYVALGTAHLMRLPFDAVWAEVQRANMAKERATGADDPRSKRRHSLDVVKPPGWKAPDHWPAIYERALAVK